MNFDLFQTCSRLCPSWLSSQPAAACTGKRSAACWMNAWPSFTPTWTEDLPTLRGSCRAGCPCPASGTSLTHLHAVQCCVCTQGEDDTGFNLTRQIKKKKNWKKKMASHRQKKYQRDSMWYDANSTILFGNIYCFFVCLLFRKRDRAHREIKNIFYKVIQKRRSSEEKADDILQTFMDSTYK